MSYDPGTGRSDDLMLARERVLFLKDLSTNPSAEIPYLASKLSIPEDRSWAYVKGFTVLAAETARESDFLKIKQILNNSVEPEYQIDEGEIARLISLVERYAEPDVLERYRFAKAQPVYAHEESVRGPADQGQNQPTIPVQQPTSQGATLNRPDQVPVYDYGSWNTQTLNKGYNYSFFQDLTRVGLMRWVLQQLPIPPRPTTIESFMRYFELNQDMLMADPLQLTMKLREWFGEKTGTHAGEMFSTYIKHLKPIEQFGVRKLDGANGLGTQGIFQTQSFNPVFQGTQFQDPFNTFYHTEGVLNFGQDARSSDARRAIWEYEQEKRRKREQQKSREDLLEDIRTKIQMDMTSFLDKTKQGGNGFGGGNAMDQMAQMMMPYVITGQMKMIPFIDPEGNTKYRFEQNPNYNQPGTAVADPNQLTARDMLDYVKGMYDLILAERTQKNNVGDTIMDKLIARALPENLNDPTSQVVQNVKAYKELLGYGQGGYNGGVGQTIEVAKVMLERDKFEADKERSEKLLDRQFEAKGKVMDAELEREKQANETKNNLIKHAGTIVSQTLPALLQLVLMMTGKGNMASAVGAIAGNGGAGNNGGGNPMGGLGGLIGNLLGGGGLDGLLKGMTGAAGNGNENEEEGLPTIGGLGPQSQPQAQSQGGGGDFMSQMANVFGSMFGGSQQTATNGAPASIGMGAPAGGFRPDSFIPVGQNPRQQPVTLTPQQMARRNPMGYTGLYDELSTPNSNEPPSNFNPYENAGVQPFPQQQPIPNTNIDPVQSQYARMMNQSYLGGQGQGQQQQPQQGQPINGYQELRVVENPSNRVINIPEEVIEESEEESEQYREYRPDDFEKLTMEQLERAAQKGRESYDSIQSYLASVQVKIEEKKGQNQKPQPKKSDKKVDTKK